jgi:hypothetical protein
LLGNAIFVLSMCAICSFIIIYKTCFSQRKKLQWSDLIYLGHFFWFTILLFIGYCWAYFNIEFRQKKVEFNNVTWKKELNKRVEMVDDLMEVKLLDQKNIPQVVEILGRPMIGFEDKSKIEFFYYVGIPQRVLKIDPEFLVVDFVQGSVKKYYLRSAGPFE